MNSTRLFFILLLSTLLVATQFGETDAGTSERRKVDDNTGWFPVMRLYFDCNWPSAIYDKKSKYFGFTGKQRFHRAA